MSAHWRVCLKPIFALVLLAVFADGEGARPIAGRIRIERAASSQVRFSPPEIVAWAGDQIHWFNDTAEPHEPGVLDKKGAFVAFLDDPVVPHATSAIFSPMPRLDAEKKMIPFTIHYVCRRHRDERGVIQVVPTP